MIAAQCLGIAAAACQGLYDVVLPYGKTVPCSLNLITLGDSGERKSATFDFAAESLKNFERKLSASNLICQQNYLSEYNAWKFKVDRLKKSVAKSDRDGRSTVDIEDRLAAITAAEPPKPKDGRLIYRDITPAALKKSLNENHPLGLILSDEAGNFFSGSMIREFNLLNDLWGGSDLIVDRVGTGSFTVFDPRFSQSIMLQPEIFNTALKNNYSALRGSGLLARSLICFPISTQGSRFNNNESQIKPDLTQYDARVNALLERTFSGAEGRIAERKNLNFDAPAKNYLNWVGDQIEMDLRPSGRFAMMSDFASKMIEHICRLAAIFHVIDDQPDGIIGEQYVKCAYEIINWYAVQFYNVVVLAMAPTQEQKDADLLFDFFLKKPWGHGLGGYTLTELRKFGPNLLRNPERLRPALDILMTNNKVVVSNIYPRPPTRRVIQKYFLANPPLIF
jgi:hypothetical protein